MNKSLNLIGLFFILCLFSVNTVFAQTTAASAGTKTEISDSELKTYSDLIKELTKIQLETQEKINALIEKEGMPLEKYQKIEQAEVLKKQNKPVKEKFTTAEMTKYDAISKKVVELRGELNKEIQDLFQNGNITPQKFQEINQALQEDMELQAKYKKYQEQ